jgi:hypothetical protein
MLGYEGKNKFHLLATISMAIIVKQVRKNYENCVKCLHKKIFPIAYFQFKDLGLWETLKI